jgi:NitT/TauT family transport system permease protein
MTVADTVERQELTIPAVPPPLPPEPARRSRVRAALRVVGPPLVVLGLVLAVWMFISYQVLTPPRRFLLPPPIDLVREGLFDTESMATILGALWSTAKVTMVGLSLSIVLGVATAVAMSQAAWIERSIFPYAVILQTIPILAIVPMLGFWFGYNFQARVIVTVAVSIFPVITNTLFGLKSASGDLQDLFTLRRATRWQRLTKLQLPSALPAMFTGFRISAGLAVVGAIVGDFLFREGEAGIGRYIDIFRQRLLTSQMFVAIICASLLGLAVFLLFGALAKRLTGAWHDSSPTP